MTIREQLLSGKPTAAPAGSNWFVTLVWALIDIDEPALVQLDKDLAAPIWGNGHTISWNLGEEEANGNVMAEEVCDVLADFLGPDHCKDAYEHGE